MGKLTNFYPRGNWVEFRQRFLMSGLLATFHSNLIPYIFKES